MEKVFSFTGGKRLNVLLLEISGSSSLNIIHRTFFFMNCFKNFNLLFWNRFILKFLFLLFFSIHYLWSIFKIDSSFYLNKVKGNWNILSKNIIILCFEDLNNNFLLRRQIMLIINIIGSFTFKWRKMLHNNCS